jgi:hypothetical protein
MSGKNKVNPDHYKVAGRLSQDDLARARRSQSEPLFGGTRSRQDNPLPPWMLKEQSAEIDDSETVGADRVNAEPKPPRKAKTVKAAKPAAKTVRSAKSKSPTARKTATSRKAPKSRVSTAKRSTPKAAARSPRSTKKTTRAGSTGKAKKKAR